MGQYFGTYGQMGQYFLKHPGFGQMGRQDGIRRVGGVNAALSEREKDGALRAPSFYILSRRICATHASIAFLRVVPSHCECLHGGHPSRPLHKQHRVASGREEETR